jgi:two-component system, OmpR family, response regulator ResD
MTDHRVLLVEDDPTVADVVTQYLQRSGFVVTHVADGSDAVCAAGAIDPDLLVLDLMLPGLDGLEVCRRVRRSHDVPIIMLTALGAESDRVLGLEVGADDYLTKPFSPRELVLRVQSVLRRSRAGEAARAPEGSHPVLRDGDLVVDTAARRAERDGVEVSLTGREFDLLAFLLAHPGQAYSRDDLLEQVWGWSFGDTSTVTVHVRRLREKIEPDPSEPQRLVTVWGVGYRWDPS